MHINLPTSCNPNSSHKILTIIRVFYFFHRHQSFVGNLKFAFGDASGKRGIVATESNVIAALNIKSGAVQRFCHVF